MAHEGANEEPHASEYAEKGSLDDSDNDEGTNVEPDASVTKLLTTQGSRDSTESTINECGCWNHRHNRYTEAHATYVACAKRGGINH